MYNGLFVPPKNKTCCHHDPVIWNHWYLSKLKSIKSPPSWVFYWQQILHAPEDKTAGNWTWWFGSEDFPLPHGENSLRFQPLSLPGSSFNTIQDPLFGGNSWLAAQERNMQPTRTAGAEVDGFMLNLLVMVVFYSSEWSTERHLIKDN